MPCTRSAALPARAQLQEPPQCFRRQPLSHSHSPHQFSRHFLSCSPHHHLRQLPSRGWARSPVRLARLLLVSGSENWKATEFGRRKPREGVLSAVTR